LKARQGKASKRFFFEKKKQKTFAKRRALATPVPKPTVNKSVFASFYS